MAKWWVHEYIAEMMGIRKKVAEEINHFVDVPRKYTFLSHQEVHDQTKKWIENVRDSTIYRTYGEEGLRALRIHLLVDYVTNFLWNPEKVGEAIEFEKEMRGITGLVGTIRDPAIRERPLPVSAWIKMVSAYNYPSRTVYWSPPKVMFKVEIPMAIKVNSEDTGQDLQKKIEKQMAVWKIERWKGEDHLSGPGIWLAKYANSLGLQSQSVAVVIVGLKNLKLAGHELI